jgi:hypothetical protein
MLLLSGEIPYRDFVTSYGPLFPLLLIPGLMLWESPGSIVLTMLTVEAAMLVTYAVRCERAGASHHWRVMFLYVFSPLSWYWVGAVGTNTVVVGFIAMLGLALAERNRNLAAGIAVTAGLLFSKITIVLAWPGILFFGRRGMLSRVVTAAVLLVAVLALAVVGVDVGERVLEQRFRATSGNIWFLLSMMIDAESDSLHLKRLSMISLVCILAPLCLLFGWGRLLRGRAGFDSAAAFVGSVNLIFMMLAYKTYPSYYAAFLVPVLHSLLSDEDRSTRRLIPLVLLGSFATLEPRLWMVVRGSNSGLGSFAGGALFAIDVVGLISILYWSILCIRRSLDEDEL